MNDDAKIRIGLLTGGLAILGTVFNSILGSRSAKSLALLKQKLDLERDSQVAAVEAEKIISKFRDPLMHAAYDLQSRIYNIAVKQFLQVYLHRGSPRYQEYAVENTVFLFAQFLAWTELIRQELQFLRLNEEDEFRLLRQHQDDLYSVMQTDKISVAPEFRLFAGEQRAIGELMIDPLPVPPRCIGYAAFLTARNPAIDRFLDPMRDDLRRIAPSPIPSNSRLIQIQHALVDLLALLDPEYVRFREDRRSRLPAA